jgi:hypothetical protein
MPQLVSVELSDILSLRCNGGVLGCVVLQHC